MHTNKHVCAFLSVSVLNAYAWEHSKDEDRKREGVEGGWLVMLPHPLPSGLNFHDQEVPHARDFWMLCASLSLADRQAAGVGHTHTIQSVGSRGKTRHYIGHPRSRD